MGRPSTIEFQLPVTCMIEAHGPLVSYQTADGKLAIKACEFCQNIAYLEGRETAAIEWKMKLAAVLGPPTRLSVARPNNDTERSPHGHS